LFGGTVVVAERRGGVAGDQGGRRGERHGAVPEPARSPGHHHQQERRGRGLQTHLHACKALWDDSPFVPEFFTIPPPKHPDP